MHFEFRGLIRLFSKINIMSLYALWNVYNGNYKTLEVYIKKIIQSRYARPYNVFICTPLEFYNFHYIHFKVHIILHYNFRFFLSLQQDQNLLGVMMNLIQFPKNVSTNWWFVIFHHWKKVAEIVYRKWLWTKRP